jgi:hypothetical protein
MIEEPDRQYAKDHRLSGPPEPDVLMYCVEADDQQNQEDPEKHGLGKLRLEQSRNIS